MEKVNKPSNWVRRSCVGRGSNGTVSLAVSKSDGQVFAVKSVGRSSGLESQVESLENEIRILRSLSSPWVVEYKGDDVTVEDGATSFRNLHLEYLPGGTVADLAKHSGADVDENIVRSYTFCVVSALRYVHSKDIVHCDVKGKNVLVGPIPGAAKLADFGLATEFAAVMPPRGSPLWMAPEVIRREYQGPESDVWSLGCTVIEMVTGRPAWEDRGADTLCRIGYSDELPELPILLSGLGRDFLDKCLRRNRTERWSCDQLLHHPFISSSAPPNLITYSSPRCVLDWLNSEFCDEDDENEEEDQSSFPFELRTHYGRHRIGKLASNTGSIWESDGWVMVRNLNSDRAAEVSYSCSCGDEEEGTSSEYSDSIETEMTNLECSDSGGDLSVEMIDSDRGWSGSSCRHGWQGCDWAVDSGRQDFTAGVNFLFINLLYFTALLCNSLWWSIIHISYSLFEISIFFHVANLLQTSTICSFLNYFNFLPRILSKVEISIGFQLPQIIVLHIYLFFKYSKNMPCFDPTFSRCGISLRLNLV